MHNRRETKAVYKPCQGETHLYDFPDGTLYKREYAAFLMSQALEWYLIPPTVIRSGPFGIGTIQWFVDTRNRANYDSVISKDLSRLKQVALFDYLVNNADRKAGHFLEGQDGRLWVVDHGLTFNTEPKLRTVLWDFSGQSIPEKLTSDVKSLQQKLKRGKPLSEMLHQLLEMPEVEALEQRIERIIENPVFSHPESYRSVPWPWI
ncbi:MAG: SCO1664 family protein [Chloroflexi bacterium]|nr:SCO1664 family protein [Chloroflexota bacterium]